ncbi:MAG: alanine racemase [Burkholderiaceae bacterium]|nr:alanine racemase [Burkholderiaceae bacterium]
MDLSQIETPALLLDLERMERNLERMRARERALGVRLRPHLKTCKSAEVARRIFPSGPGPITVSTLREAEQFLEHGFNDILYAVGIAPGKIDHVAALRRRGAELAIVVDGLQAARAVALRAAQLGDRLAVLIEIDCDGHRAGVRPGDRELLVAIASTLKDAADLRGVMTHAGASYDCRTVEAIRAMAESERTAVLESAAVLRAADHAAPVVSVGSTPTASFAEHLEGVTEMRAGVYVFQDLVMAGLGVCTPQDIALSVLTTVIGHQRDKGWIVTDAGWMAMSRDRGTSAQAIDQGYGLVCDARGRPLEPLVLVSANQEHGVIGRRDGGSDVDVDRFPVGTLLRVLPNHACATAAQHRAYRIVSHDGATIVDTWERFGGW